MSMREEDRVMVRSLPILAIIFVLVDVLAVKVFQPNPPRLVAGIVTIAAGYWLWSIGFRQGGWLKLGLAFDGFLMTAFGALVLFFR